MSKLKGGTRRNEQSEANAAIAVQSKLSDLKAEIEQIRDEEQEAYDNLPESIQDSPRGERMEEAIDELYDAASDLEGVIDTLEAATE